MANQYETELAYFRVMMDLQSWFLAKVDNNHADMLRWEHNLRQHVLYYRDHVLEHHQAPEWEADKP